MTKREQRRMRRLPVGAVLTALVSMVLVAGCSVTPVGGVVGSGALASETRDVESFDAIDLQGSGVVNVTVTGTNSLTIEAEENLIPYLTSEVEDGRLVLGTSRSMSPTRGIVYTVTVAELSGVTISGSGAVSAPGIAGASLIAEIDGSGTIELEGIMVEGFEATIAGSGNVRVTGRSGGLELSIPGSGSFAGEDLEARSASVEISGSGSAVVRASDTLDAVITGSGTIRYLGDPVVNSEVTGSGSVGPG